MERNFIAEVNHIEQNAEIFIAELMDKNNLYELSFTQPHDISYYGLLGGIITTPCFGICVGVNSLDDVAFIIEDNNKVFSTDVVCGTMSYFATHIVEDEILALNKRVAEQEDLLHKDPTYTTRVFFLPNRYYNENMEVDNFVSKAFMYGKVLTLDEYTDLFNNGNLGDIHPEFGTIKILEYTNECVELCPHCECEVVLKTEFRVQTCPVCGKKIAPCNLCNGNCVSNCPINARKL